MFLSLAFTGLALVAAAMFPLGTTASEPTAESSHSYSAVALAILGDSDSHSYQDSLAFGANPQVRGGSFRSTSFNWPEVLVRLRGSHFDLGRWGIWGSRYESLAAIGELFGVSVRLPRKEDYEHNFAFSGATCSDLTGGRYRQADRLLALMDGNPEQWRRGIVVIRIGVNSFGGGRSLERLALNPNAPDVVATMAGCVDEIQRTLTLVQSRHPESIFVLVGIFNNAHWPRYTERWQSEFEQRNISQGLDHFDNALRALVDEDTDRRLFFDDRAWFTARWGSRATDGSPDYREFLLDGGFAVRNAAGDDPSNTVVSDGHAGTVWNGLWAQALVEALNSRFKLDVPPISEREIASLIARPGAEEEAGADQSRQKNPVIQFLTRLNM